jgi:hypothetical protein
LSEVSFADDGLELDRGELAEGALPPAVVVGAFDPGDDRQAELLAGGPGLAVQDVLLQSAVRRVTSWRTVDPG